MKIIWEVLHLQKTVFEGYLSSWDPVVIRVLEVAPTRRIQRPLNQECSFLIVSPKDQVTRKQTGLCVPVMFSKMALSRTIIFALLSVQFHFVFTDGHEKPMERNRLKRALSDDDIILGLKMYETKMAGLQRKIAQQLASMKKQKSRINFIKFYMKRKGDDYEKEDLEGNIIADTEKGKQNLQLASLDNLVKEADHQEKRQRGLLEELKKENTVMSDIHKRVLDNNAICRDTYTEWKDVGSGTIRELSKQYVKCNEDELLLRFYLQKKSTAAKKIRYKYRCCRFSLKDKWQRPDDM